jgi:hypothetical protein
MTNEANPLVKLEKIMLNYMNLEINPNIGKDQNDIINKISTIQSSDK